MRKLFFVFFYFFNDFKVIMYLAYGIYMCFFQTARIILSNDLHYDRMIYSCSVIITLIF